MVCLFSRSGSVMIDVLDNVQFQTKNLGMELTIMTNNFDETTYDNRLFRYKSFMDTLIHVEIENILEKMEPTVILLFGYLRILSPEICKRHTIYNLHPGDIVAYPELKGKDPIEKYFSNLGNCGPVSEIGYELGCVIHKVTKEVDEGPILSRIKYIAADYEDAVSKSRKVAIEMWIDFINFLR